MGIRKNLVSVKQTAAMESLQTDNCPTVTPTSRDENKQCAVSLMQSLRPPIVMLDLRSAIPSLRDPSEGLAAWKNFAPLIH